mmetsp:Transcript_48949/g.60168  ORF Transcript_48949/g.60168 Transcript_48949/m.60168 type:complete len:316 (+) Transcript_48949:48-995(+)
MLHLIVMNGLCIGYILLMYFVYHFFILIKQFIRHPKDLNNFGEWCIVTDGINGIGKAICFELASKGQNILIIGGNELKLNRVINEINDIYPDIVLEKCHINLSKFDDDMQNRYKNAIQNKNIGVLINNVGLSYQTDNERIENIMKVGNEASTTIVHITLKEFLKYHENDPNKLSAIVNISSKDYVNKITSDLGFKYSGKGISFQVQSPYFVSSKMGKIGNPTFITPTAQKFAKYSVSQIGYDGLIYPYPKHALMFFIASLLPQKLTTMYLHNIYDKIMDLGNKKMVTKQKMKMKKSEMGTVFQSRKPGSVIKMID